MIHIYTVLGLCVPVNSPTHIHTHSGVMGTPPWPTFSKFCHLSNTFFVINMILSISYVTINSPTDKNSQSPWTVYILLKIIFTILVKRFLLKKHFLNKVVTEMPSRAMTHKLVLCVMIRNSTPRGWQVSICPSHCMTPKSTFTYYLETPPHFCTPFINFILNRFPMSESVLVPAKKNNITIVKSFWTFLNACNLLLF